MIETIVIGAAFAGGLALAYRIGWRRGFEARKIQNRRVRGLERAIMMQNMVREQYERESG